MNAAVLERLTLESRLRGALDEGALHLVFQPRWNLATGRVVGMEALIRWRDRQLGSVPPSRFIPIAEETGLIISIGSWVLQSACTQILGWESAGYEPVPVAVNVSARQFQSDNFVGNVQTLLMETGLPAHLLTIELTESVLMRNAEVSAEELRGLKALGVSIAIDDFGTGYSSLSISSDSRSTTSRSINRSFAGSPPTRTTPKSRARSSPSHTASTSASSPRASNPKSNARGLPIKDATRFRDSS